MGPWGQEFSELWCFLQVLEARPSKQGEGLSCYPAEGHVPARSRRNTKGGVEPGKLVCSGLYQWNLGVGSIIKIRIKGCLGGSVR